MTRGWGGWAVVVLALGCATASAQQPLDWPRESPPPPLPARQVHFPPYEIRTLSTMEQVGDFEKLPPGLAQALTIPLLRRLGAAVGVRTGKFEPSLVEEILRS